MLMRQLSKSTHKMQFQYCQGFWRIAWQENTFLTFMSLQVKETVDMEVKISQVVED